MKLVISGVKNWDRDEFRQLIDTYKYKEDVVIPEGLYEWEETGLLTAAYALVMPNSLELSYLQALDAMQSDVPVIASIQNTLHSIAPNEAIYFNENDINELGEKLMIIYKDESFRSQLIDKSRLFISDKSWDKSADILWSFLTK